MTEKKCPDCGKPMAKSGSNIEPVTGNYVEQFVCSECGNVWHHKPDMQESKQPTLSKGAG